MARRNFATVDALLALACVVIFAGGVLAQTIGSSQTPPPTPAHSTSSNTGDRS